MKDWHNHFFLILLFIPALMGTLSYLSYLREKETELKNLTEFWASIGVREILMFFFIGSMDGKAAIPMLSWFWTIRTYSLVLQDISRQKVFKRGHFLFIISCGVLTFILSSFSLSFELFTIPLSFSMGIIGIWASWESYRRMVKEDITSLHVSSFILFALFFIRVLTYPFWRSNSELIYYGVFSDIFFFIGFSGIGLSTYLENLKTKHNRRINKIQKDRNDRILGQFRYFEFGLLFGGFSHEINNPLTVIKARALMLSRVLNQNQNQNNEEMKHGLDQILRSVDKINAILQKTKEYLSYDTNEKKKEVPLNELFDDVLSFYGQRLKNHGVNVRFYGVNGNKLYCNKSEIEQVMINLLSNSLDAIEFLPDKWIEITVFEKPDSFSIQVVDSGSGIPDEIIPQIMEPFFSTKENKKGTGMGLYSAREYVRKHGGDLTYIPNRKHTTFMIDLPKGHVQEWDMVLH